VPDNVQNSDPNWVKENTEFYKKWFVAQVTGYEKSTNCWIFWTWKSELGDYRWPYQQAVSEGIIPTDLSTLQSPCQIHSHLIGSYCFASLYILDDLLTRQEFESTQTLQIYVALAIAFSVTIQRATSAD
jgi:hypothetical protein